MSKRIKSGIILPSCTDPRVAKVIRHKQSKRKTITEDEEYLRVIQAVEMNRIRYSFINLFLLIRLFQRAFTQKLII